MIFLVDTTTDLTMGKVYYMPNEYSIYTEQSRSEIDFEISINKLICSVVDNQIIQVWGYVGDCKWNAFTMDTPKSAKGNLNVFGDFEYGFCYGMNETPLPVSFNEATNCLCIGNPLEKGTAVEFIENCIAIISDSGFLCSLWIRLSLLQSTN